MNRGRILTFLLVLISFPLLYLGALLVSSTGSQMQVSPQPSVVGLNTPLRLTVANPHGLRALRAALEQGGKQYPLLEKTEPAHWWRLFPPALPPSTADFEAGAKRAPGLKDGKAQLIVEAVSNDLRGRTDSLRLDVEINTQPPAVSVDDTQRYFTVGGSGLVVFTAAGYWTEAGVRVGRVAFPSYPLPGGGSPNRRACFFPLPYDMGEDDALVVYVRNPTGAEAVSRFRHELKRKRFRHREITVSETFLNKVIQELDTGGAGTDPVRRFVKVNSQMRAANAATLTQLGAKSASRILWNGAFVQLSGSAVEAQFCDYRTYKYQGKRIDEQVHLGFDLATTAHAPVTASNDGVVVYAAPLGIYGNAIVIDHGMGLQSLYAHLSEFGVKVGDAVKKGQGIGRTGSTGMAGGDHLHFTILVGGAPVNPVEWWDPHWIQDRVDAQLAAK